MNIFDLAAVITLDSSAYERGLKSAESKTSSFGSKIGTAVKVAGGAVATAATAVGALAKKSVDAYGEFEQLEGGVKKLFGDNAAKQIMKYADSAYQSAGVSANQYMQQVTSFSASLISSLGGDTEKAAEQANKAMIAMSDNANTFGTDIGSIQNAFQGFAKQNYTMLDNLKLGYGGTKTEMQRLIKDANEYAVSIGEAGDLSIDSFSDIVTAIDLVQQKQNIAGTTMKEANTTIQGSFGMLKASWENLLTSFGRGPKETKEAMTQLVSNATTVLKNLVPLIGSILSSIADALPEIITTLTDQLPDLISELLPKLINAAIVLIQGLIKALPKIVTGLIATAKSVGKSVIDSMSAAITKRNPKMGKAFDKTVATAKKSLGKLGSSFQEALPKIIEVVSGAFERIKVVWETVLYPVFSKIIDVVVNTVIPTLKASFEKIAPVIQAVFQNIVNIWDSYLLPTFQAIAGFVTDTILPAFERVFPKVQEIVTSVFTVIVGLWNDYLSVAFKALYHIVTEIILPAFQAAWPVIEGVVTGAMNAIKYVWDNFLSPALTALRDFVMNTLVPAFEENWPKIKQFATDAMDGIKAFWDTFLKPVFEAIKNFVVDTLVPIFEENWPKIKRFATNAMSVIVNFWDNNLKPVFDKIGEVVGDVLEPLFEDAWPKMKRFATNAMSTIQQIWDNHLKPAFTAIVDTIKDMKDKFDLRFGAIKTKVSDVFGAIKDFWTGTLKPVFDDVMTKVETIRATWATKWEMMKTKAQGVWTTVKTTVGNAVDFIKSLLAKITWKLPDIKLPHIKWRWSDMGFIKIPKFWVSWYARAYDNPFLFDSKRVLGGLGFGDRGNYQGGEMVYSHDKLMDDIGAAVQSQLGGVYSVLQEYLPTIAMNSNRNIVLDDGAVVGAMIPKIDQELGRLQDKRGRGL